MSSLNFDRVRVVQEPGQAAVVESDDCELLDMNAIRKIFSSATNSVLPQTRLRQILQFDGKYLKVDDDKAYLVPKEGCHVVGFGKAVIGMAAEFQRIVQPHNIQKAVLSVPKGICDTMITAGHPEFIPEPQEGLHILEGAHNNIPDHEAFEASKVIAKMAESLKNDSDLLFVLISGGGSALLPSPIYPLTLNDKASLTKKLSRSGATIQELNAVRIQLSNLKGGKLAKLAKPAQVVSFILSDIIDDPMELISSGPTVLMPNLPNALDILQKYNISIDDHVRQALEKQNSPKNIITNNMNAEDNNVNNVHNILIGTNKIALETCYREAIDHGFEETIILTSRLSGEAQKVGALFGQLIYQFCNSGNNLDLLQVKNILVKLNTDEEVINKIVEKISAADKNFVKMPLCFLAGGETTVEVQGSGKGGRNQEMAMATMIEYQYLISKHKKTREINPKKVQFTFLSAGTDGIDGPTNAAGAIVNQKSFTESEKQGLDPIKYLKNNDSNTYFNLLNGGKNLVVTGHTGTNVMDIQIILIHP